MRAPDNVREPCMSSAGEPELATVIVPTFNRAQLLSRALDSVWRQTYRPIELIVVDDGSTDGTDRIVKEWMAHKESSDFLVHYIHSENAGAPNARNVGLKCSTGCYIQFLDSDDLLHPRKLEWQIDALRDYPSADYAFSTHVKVSGEPDLRTLEALADGDTFKPAPSDSIPSGVAWGLFRRSACVDLGPWDVALPRHQDWEYGVRLSNLNVVVVRNADPLYIHVSHGGDRIDDLRKNHRKSLAGVIAAVESATEATSRNRSNAARTKIVRKIPEALLLALLIDDLAAAERVLHLLRKLVPLWNPTRIKCETVFLARCVGGRSAAQRIALRYV